MKKIYACLLVAAVLGSACPIGPGVPCSKDSECTLQPGGFCDSRTGYCAYRDLDAGVSVSLISPSNNATVGASVALAAQVTGGAPASLTYIAQENGATVSTGSLSQSGGQYVATWAPPDGGAYVLSAQYLNALDGGTVSSNSVTVEVDLTPPDWILVVDPPPTRTNTATLVQLDPTVGFDAGTAFRRDDIANVRLYSSATDVDAGSVHIGLAGLDSVVADLPLTVCDAGTHAFCRQASIDFSKPGMQAFDGYFVVSGSGADIVNNAARAQSVAVPVTRWKWSYITSGALPIKGSPAIGHLGTLYFGTTNGGASGSFYALNPDGTSKWVGPDAVGSVVASPAVGAWDGGDETVFVASTVPGGALMLAIQGADGGTIDSYNSGTANDGVESALAVAPTTNGTVVESGFAVLNLNSGMGRLIAFRPKDSTQTIAFSVPKPVKFPSAVVTDGVLTYFGDSAGKLRGLSVVGGNWVANGGSWPVTFGTLWANGLSLDSGGANVFGTAITGNVFKVVASSGSLTSFSDSNPTWGVTLSGSNKVFFTDEAPSLNQTPTGLPATLDQTAATPSKVTTAPLVGSNSHVYTISSGGQLESWPSPLAASTPEWSAPGFGPVNASPNIDCSRDGSGNKSSGRPGALYFGNDTGLFFSVIVDSPSIDTSAPWPKYQHDPRNTGNSSTSLTEFNCP